MSWLDSFLTSGYKAIAIAGVVVAQEQTMNFVSGFTSTDDPVNGFTNLTPVGAGAPTGTGVALVSGGNFVGAAGTVNLASSTYVSGVLGTANGGVGSTGTAGQVFAATGSIPVANGWASFAGDLTTVGTSSGTITQTVTTITGGAPSGVSMAASNYTFTAGAIPVFKQTVAVAGNGTPTVWRTQAAFPTGNGNGGNFQIITGKEDGTGTLGSVVFSRETVAGGATVDVFQFTRNGSGAASITAPSLALSVFSGGTLRLDAAGGTGAFFALTAGTTFQVQNRNTGEVAWSFDVANAGAITFMASKIATSVKYGITTQTTTTNGLDLVISGQANSNVGSGNGGGINLTMGTSTAGIAGKLKLTNMGALATSGTAFSGGFAVPATAKGVPVLVDGVSILLLACTP